MFLNLVFEPLYPVDVFVCSDTNRFQQDLDLYENVGWVACIDLVTAASEFTGVFDPVARRFLWFRLRGCFVRSGFGNGRNLRLGIGRGFFFGVQLLFCLARLESLGFFGRRSCGPGAILNCDRVGGLLLGREEGSSIYQHGRDSPAYPSLLS